MQLMSPIGCNRCSNTGYYDRFPVLEMWNNNRDVKRVIHEQAGPEEILKVVMRDGFQSFQVMGLKMVASGLTSFEEMERGLSGLA